MATPSPMPVSIVRDGVDWSQIAADMAVSLTGTFIAVVAALALAGKDDRSRRRVAERLEVAQLKDFCDEAKQRLDNMSPLPELARTKPWLGLMKLGDDLHVQILRSPHVNEELLQLLFTYLHLIQVATLALQPAASYDMDGTASPEELATADEHLQVLLDTARIHGELGDLVDHQFDASDYMFGRPHFILSLISHGFEELTSGLLDRASVMSMPRKRFDVKTWLVAVGNR